MTENKIDKVYSSGKYGNTILENQEELQKYVTDRYRQLIDTINHPKEHYQVKLKILKEFKESFDYDCEHAVFESTFGHFDEGEEKEFRRLHLLHQLFVRQLGAICTSYHVYIMKYGIFPKLKFPTFPIDFAEVYETASGNYVRVLQEAYGSGKSGSLKTNPLKEAKGVIKKTISHTGKTYEVLDAEEGKSVNRLRHAVSTTYIFPALIEKILLATLENTVIKSWLMKMKDVQLKGEEKRIYDFILPVGKGQEVKVTGSYRKMLRRIWDIGERHQAFASVVGIKRVMYGKNDRGDDLTIGDILTLPFAEKVILPEYFEIMKLLFGRKDINLRNQIVHGTEQISTISISHTQGLCISLFWIWPMEMHSFSKSMEWLVWLKRMADEGASRW